MRGISIFLTLHAQAKSATVVLKIYIFNSRGTNEVREF
jgi:hypothetical protein